MSDTPLPFIELLKAEIARLEDILSRNRTSIELQAARRTLAAYEGKQAGGRAAKRTSCKCGAAFSTHPMKIIAGVEKRFCPRTDFTREYEAAT